MAVHEGMEYVREHPFRSIRYDTLLAYLISSLDYVISPISATLMIYVPAYYIHTSWFSTAIEIGRHSSLICKHHADF